MSFKYSAAPLRALVFFAANPEEELAATDVAAKFGIPIEDVSHTFRAVVVAGWLARERRVSPHSPSGVRTFYMAGPRLRKELGIA